MHARSRTRQTSSAKIECEEIPQACAPNPAAAGEMHAAVEQKREREEERSQEPQQNSFFMILPCAVPMTGRILRLKCFIMMPRLCMCARKKEARRLYQKVATVGSVKSCKEFCIIDAEPHVFFTELWLCNSPFLRWTVLTRESMSAADAVATAGTEVNPAS